MQTEKASIPPAHPPNESPSAIDVFRSPTPKHPTTHDDPLAEDQMDPDENSDSRSKWFRRSAQMQLPARDNVEVTREPESPWGIYWTTPLSMVGLLIFGIAVAVVHHLYYTTLDKTSAGTIPRQQWVSRIGTGLAFLFKTTLVSAVKQSRTQSLWMTLRDDTMTLGGIDALFAVTNNPRHFLSWEMLRSAQLASVMAFVAWTIPLAAITTPATISVKRAPKPEYRKDCTAPSVRYPFDDQSKAVLVDAQNAYPMALRYHNQYFSPTDHAYAGFISAAYNFYGTGRPAPISINKCPTAAYCKYNITVVIPGLSCSLEASYESERVLWEVPEPWVSVFPGSVNGLYPLFVARKESRNTLRIGLTDKPSDNGTFRHSVITCKNSIVQQTLSISSDNDGDFDMAGTDRDSRSPKLLHVVEDIVGAEDPQSPKYDPTFALFDTVTRFLEGSIFVDDNFQFRSTLNMTNNHVETNMTSIGVFMPQSSSYNITLDGLLGRLQSVTIAMAMMPMFTNDSETSALINTTCLVNEHINIYVYNPNNLFIAYGTSGVLTIFITLLGLYALQKNGVSSDENFSTILRTTRNPTLDASTMGSCVGGSPLPDSLSELKMRFGVVIPASGGDRAAHTAFGVIGKDRVGLIRKGGRYS